MPPTSDPGPTPLAEGPPLRDGARASLRALAAVESRRLIFHHLVVVSVPLTGLFAVAAAGNPDEDFLSYKFVVGGTLLFYATAVMLAASAAASRSRRSGTDELFATMPVQPPGRTAALFAALGPAVVVAAVAQAVLMLALGSWDGLETPAVPPTEIGVQTVVVTPGAAALPFLLWWQWDWQRFLLPVAHDLRTAGSVDLGAGRSALHVLEIDTRCARLARRISGGLDPAARWRRTPS